MNERYRMPLAVARKLKGLSQEKVAKELGISAITLSSYERYAGVPPRVDIAIALSKLYEVPMDNLIFTRDT